MVNFPLNTDAPYLLQTISKYMRKHSFGSKWSLWPIWLPFTPICILHGQCHPRL